MKAAVMKTVMNMAGTSLTNIDTLTKIKVNKMENCTEDNKPDYATVLAGLSMLGSVYQGNGTELGMFLSGLYDKTISVSIFYKLHNKLPETYEEARQNTETQEPLEVIKSYFRTQLQYAINREVELEEKARILIKNHDAEIAKKNFVNQHKPSPEGTVKELAVKYNKSIGEIRRMKAEDRLHELTEQKEN